MSLFVQYQSSGLNWQNISVLLPDSSSLTILREMENAQQIMPSCRIRVVDQAGRLIDKL